MSTITRQLKKPWIVMPALAVLAVAGWVVFKPSTSSDDAAGQAEPQVVGATIGTMSRTVAADGTVAAADTEDLSFSASGTVTAVNVKAGDKVTEGQVLAQIDSVQLEADVASAEASVADAEAKLADDTDAGASDAQLQADESSLTSANDQLDAANEALEGADLVAGFDGTVATVDITTGEKLADGGTGGTGLTGSGSGSGASASTLGSDSGAVAFPGAATATDSSSSDGAHISLVSAGTFVVELGFDDSDIANIEVGQVATIATSTSSSSSGFPGGGGFPGQASASSGDDAGDGGAAALPDVSATADTGIEGIVTEVGMVADASSGVAEYPVTVAFTDETGEFNVGASVAVDIAYEEVEDAISVPSFAVTTTDGASTVEVQTDGSTETRTVQTGLTSGNMIQITDGLSEGESVVIDIPAIGDRGGDAGGGGAVGGAGGGGIPEGFTPPAGFTPPGGGG